MRFGLRSEDCSHPNETDFSVSWTYLGSTPKNVNCSYNNVSLHFSPINACEITVVLTFYQDKFIKKNLINRLYTGTHRNYTTWNTDSNSKNISVLDSRIIKKYNLFRWCRAPSTDWKKSLANFTLSFHWKREHLFYFISSIFSM